MRSVALYFMIMNKYIPFLYDHWETSHTPLTIHCWSRSVTYWKMIENIFLKWKILKVSFPSHCIYFNILWYHCKIIRKLLIKFFHVHITDRYFTNLKLCFELPNRTKKNTVGAERSRQSSSCLHSSAVDGLTDQQQQKQSFGQNSCVIVVVPVEIFSLIIVLM